MIQKFVERFDAAREDLAQEFRATPPQDYEAIVKAVVRKLHDDNDYGGSPDPERIHRIDDGDYQGTLVFVVGADGYQPSTYWYVRIGYGSCSGCDTLKSIRSYSDDPLTNEQVADYMKLALHVVQNLKQMDDGGLE